MSRIKARWQDIGEFLAAWFWYWLIVSVLVVVFVVILIILDLVVTFIVTRDIGATVDALAQIIELFVVGSEVLFWLLVIWLAILFIPFILALFVFIGDLWLNFFEKWRDEGLEEAFYGLISDASDNAKHVWNGLKRKSKEFGARAKAAAKTAWDKLTGGIGQLWDWFKSKVPGQN